MIRRLLAGALSGLIATVPMTGVMLAGQRLELLRRPPPATITARLERWAGVRHDLSRPEFEASWIASHLGFGAAMGAVYALLRRILPRSPIVSGLAFGEGVWALAYLGALPQLNLYRSIGPKRSGPDLVMIAAHAVYGITAALFDRLLAPRA